jgi:hypothetical protein
MSPFNEDGFVSLEAVQAALRFATYLQGHAERIYASGDATDTASSAIAILAKTADEIRFRSGVIIHCSANNFRTVRGKNVLLAVCDEISFGKTNSVQIPSRNRQSLEPLPGGQRRPARLHLDALQKIRSLVRAPQSLSWPG